jgi:hypothetical protein
MEKNNKKRIILAIIILLVIILIIVLNWITCFGCGRHERDIYKLTDQELTSSISKAFGSEDAKLAIYPQSGELNIKRKNQEAIGLGIRNLLEGVSGIQKFSYEVVVGQSTCGGENNDDLLNWIILGKSQTNISIDFRDYYSTKIYFKIPADAPLCTVKYKVEVKTDNGQIGKSYDYASMPFIINSRR